jgi:hypothetical protein
VAAVGAGTTANRERCFERHASTQNLFRRFPQDEAANAAASMDARFVLSASPIAAQSIILIGGVHSIAGIVSFRDLGQEQKLLAHFGKAGTTIFLIQKIK